MSISSETSKVTYDCDGATTEFAVTFDVLTDSVTGDAENIKVTLEDSDGNETVLTETTHYTISGLNVTTVSTYPSGYRLTLSRAQDFTQTVDLVEGGQFSAETIERALDNLTLQNQEQNEQLDRVVRIPITETGVSLTLPTAENRAGQALIFDADGNIDTTPGTPPKLWSALVVYDNDEIVQYSGDFYRSKEALNTGNTPAGGAADTHWEKIPFFNVWASTYIYPQYAVVSYQGTLYLSLQDDNEGNTPSTATAWWEELRTGGALDADYTLAEAFAIREIGAVDSSGEAVLADVTDSSLGEIIGVATAAGSATDVVRFQQKGILTGFSGLTIGAHYYANDSAGITEGTAHLADGDRRWYIGMAVAADTMFLDVREVQPEATIHDPVPIGFIAPFAHETVPVGWLECDGTAVSRTVYSELFAKIGTTWGSGDGSTTFNLPDLRGAFLRGTGSHGSETMADGNAFAGPAVGSFEDDQLQGHEHLPSATWNVQDVSGGYVAIPTSADLSGNVVDIDGYQEDAPNGIPRTGDETRPFAAGVSYMIKASRVTATGTPVTSQKYDTGWVANSDWTNAEFTVTHGLGADLSGMIVKVYLSTDGTDATSFEIVNAQFTAATDAERMFGYAVRQSSTNEIVVQTGLQGLIHIDDDGSALVIDTESYYYRVVVYKPEIIARSQPSSVRAVSADYTITGRDDARIINVTTGATDRTVTLPAGSGMEPGDDLEIHKVDSGAGKVTISRAGTDTIDGVASIDIDSQYDMARLRWSGSYWALIEYKDHGNNTYGSWKRFADGTIEMWGTASDSVSAAAVKSISNRSLPQSLSTTDEATISAVCRTTVSGAAWLVYVAEIDTVSTVDFAATDRDGTARTGSLYIRWKVTGRWRD